MSHLGKACDYLDVVQAHLDAAKDPPPEMPVEIIEFLQTSLHDIWLICDDHARRRRTYGPPFPPSTGDTP